MSIPQPRDRRTSGRAATLAGVALAVAAVAVPVVGLAGTSAADTVEPVVTSQHFQFGSAATPVAAGYTLDTGAAYSDASGHGWLKASGEPLSMTWAGRVRSTGATLERGNIQASKSGSGVNWKLELDNGTYSVTVGVGDSSYTDSVNTVSANGASLISAFTPTATNHFAVGRANVAVTDGHLLLDTVGGKNVKLNYVDVAPAVVSNPSQPATDPTATSPTHLAWFYNPPASSSDTSMVAKSYDTYFLSNAYKGFAARVKAANRSAQVSQYFLFDQIIKPPVGGQEFHNNAAYRRGDFQRILTKHPDWFLRDAAGQMIVDGGIYYRMDPGNAAWQAFWLMRVAEANATWGGVFLDNVDASMCGYHIDVPKYDDATYSDAIAGFLKNIYTSYFKPTGRQLTMNLINQCTGRDYSAKYTGAVTGIFHEAWSVDWHTGFLSAKTWNAQLTQAESDVADGKRLTLVAQGPQNDTVRQQFAFNSYLLVQTPEVSFRYTVYTTAGYAQPWMYSNYDAKLGVARGARYQLSDGSYRRDYSNGYVTVNPSTHASKLVVNS